MSRRIALAAINGRATERIPHWEYISHPDFVRHVTGIDPYDHPQKAELRLLELVPNDVALVPLSDEPVPRLYEEGQTERVDEDGTVHPRWGMGDTWRWDYGRGFESVEQVLSYRPLEEGLIAEDIDELARGAQEGLDAQRRLLGERALAPGSFYQTLFMWPLMTFGWELFIEAAMTESQRFQVVLDQFGELSLRVMTAWAKTDVELFVSHDDLCITRGPAFNPKWYRKHIYPWYERLWDALHACGCKIIFQSDGNIDEVADDVFAAGADGAFFEPYTDLEKLVRKWGDSKILVGNIDTRVLKLGDPDAVRAEVRRCTELGKACPGYFYSVSNHIPYDTPVENILAYFEACEEMGRR